MLSVRTVSNSLYIKYKECKNTSLAVNYARRPYVPKITHDTSKAT
jgi:hypothetical protein